MRLTMGSNGRNSFHNDYCTRVLESLWNVGSNCSCCIQVIVFFCR